MMQRAMKIAAVWGALLALVASMGVAAAQVQIAMAPPAGAAKLGDAGAAKGDDIVGPLLGYVFNGTQRTIHPIQGITGAAQVGPAVASNISFSAVGISPTHTFGLGVEAGTGKAYYLELTPATSTAVALGAVNDGADRVVMSPSGSAAIFYDRSSQSAQVVSGLPGDREVRGQVALDALPGVISALAVNDEGDAILIGISDENGGSLYLGGNSRNLQNLRSLGRVSSVAFLPDSNDAVVADHDRSEVILLKDFGAGGSTVLTGEQDGLVQPAVVAASADGASIFAATAQGSAIARVATSGGVPSLLACDCRPTNLLPLVGNAVFVVNSTSQSPLLVYDGDRESNGQPDPRIWFVPPSDATAVLEVTPVDAPRLPRGRSAR